ncbi:hypothetical protein FGW37_13990 [Streptomyces rectiverticillatus]|uniref:hypothetical protein n=1 Tax=Streptomyces rectiverticillatus TaxID=173860 RepID=UPI0015C2D985|nr:hypothetical protein [Streptomyces rectiverticillatus]QLE72562.1 hypothetical protein FGW37_13990 [Streptomyces rectiverticillatus]
MPAPEQPQQPQSGTRSEERPPSTSMRDLLASCAAADAVSKPPRAPGPPEAPGDDEQDAA